MRALCPYCNTDSDFYFRSRDYNRNVTDETFDHYRCPQCELVFISPFPENLDDYYPQEYYYIPESTDFLKENSEHEKYKVEIIKRYVKQGRLLEIGPSLGTFIYRAKQSGFNVEAIEMDERCSKFLNEVAEIPTVNSNDACAALNSLEPYDVITMWHVIEHLPNPWEMLDAISKKIKPGGILVIAAPNPDAFQFQILGRYWPHVDAPRHLMLISSKLIVEKMKGLGMSVELITTMDEGGLGWDVFGWEYFFSNLCRSLRVKKILQIVGRIIAKIVAPIEQREGKGSAYTIVFRKDG